MQFSYYSFLKHHCSKLFIDSFFTVQQITGEFPNVREAIYHVTSRLRDSLFSNAMKSSVTKSNSTLTTERIHRGQSDNPLSVGSHQSFGHPPTISTSLHRRSDDSYLSGSQLSINYSRPAVADPYTRPEDPVPDRFNPSAGYSPNFGRRSAMDHHDISHHLTETASRMWASPVCFRLVFSHSLLSSEHEYLLLLNEGFRGLNHPLRTLHIQILNISAASSK